MLVMVLAAPYCEKEKRKGAVVILQYQMLLLTGENNKAVLQAEQKVILQFVIQMLHYNSAVP